MLALALLLAAPVPPEKPPADWSVAVKDRDFQFDPALAGLDNGTARAKKAGAEVTANGLDNREITVTWPGGKGAKFLGHAQSAFAVRDGKLYAADFHPSSTGCEVLAYDLVTGKVLWKRPLVGLGPIEHTKYRNRVTLAVEKHPAADAWAVVVFGEESAGRYVELLDPATGKQVAHKKYPRE